MYKFVSGIGYGISSLLLVIGFASDMEFIQKLFTNINDPKIWTQITTDYITSSIIGFIFTTITIGIMAFFGIKKNN